MMMNFGKEIDEVLKMNGGYFFARIKFKFIKLKTLVVTLTEYNTFSNKILSVSMYA
jgi:hypothetical protein